MFRYPGGNKESETLHKGPYIIHTCDFGCGDERCRYVERTQLYIGEEILFKDEDSGVALMNVPPDIEANFSLSIYYPGEI